MIRKPTILFLAVVLTLGVFVGGTETVFAATTGFTTQMVEIPASVKEGQDVDILVGFVNEESKGLTGKINFYNGDELLGSRELALEAGQSGEYILTWTAVLGSHSFTAKAEQLKLEGSSVTILGPETEPKELMIGFKNSSVADNLRERGSFGAIVAGVIDEIQNFFVPIIKSLDDWRLSKIEPLQETKLRIDEDKELSEEKIKPLLVIHSLFLTLMIFIVSKKAVFFVLVCLTVLWILIRIVKLFRRIIRKDYSQEQ